MEGRFWRIFGKGSKPVIAMAHLGPLPGTPLYDEARGVEPDQAKIREAKDAVAGLAPVLANTGAKAANVALFLQEADGVIVGSDLKAGGGTWNPVDPERVKRFLEAAGRV